MKTGDKLERWHEHFVENILNIPTEVKEVALNRIPQICHSGRDRVSGIGYSYLMWGTVSHRLFKWHPQRKEKKKEYTK